MGIAILIWAWELFYFVDRTNRDLSNFLLSLNHDDYAGNYEPGKKGKSFRHLYNTFASINEKYRTIAAQKEVQFIYLQTLVEHIKVAILCFSEGEEIQLMNQAFKDLIQKPYLVNVSALESVAEKLLTAIREIQPGEQHLVQFLRGDRIMELSIRATEFKLHDQSYKLISAQDIKTELEEKELQAWQKLIRVLTHEIVNSVTPISTLSSALYHKLSTNDSQSSLMPKMERGLAAIKDRSQALLDFTSAYQQLTRIPTPQMKLFKVNTLFRRIELLFTETLQDQGIELILNYPAKKMEITGDLTQVEQVLINLIKNAADAVKEKSDGKVELSTANLPNGQICLKVIDNGGGIAPEIIDQIFVPFFTTREEGSGIGLSLSRQIMRLHQGDLMVFASSELGTEFRLVF